MQEVKPLTAEQKKALDFILFYHQEHGYSPSLKDIAEHFGSNTSTAQYYVKELKNKGYLKKEANKARGITPIARPRTTRKEGKIAGGKPIEVIEDPEDIEVPPGIKLTPNHSYYALEVEGDSMMDMGILNGDTVLIQHQMTAENGDTVVAITEKGATLKVFKKINGKILLEPRNKDYPTIEPKELEIRGKFIGLVRTG